MGVTIQADMLEAADMLPDGQADEFIAALVRFGINGEVPDEGKPWYPMFHIVRDRIQMSAEKSSAAQSLANARWAKKRMEEAQGDAQDNAQVDAHDHAHGDAEEEAHGDAQQGEGPCAPMPTHDAEVRGVEDKGGKEKGGKGSRPRKRFRAPTVQEVSEYAEEQSLNVDAVRFCDYYESCGWTVGRNRPMRDWKAAARRWSRNEYGDTSREVSADGWYDFASLNAE